MDIGTIESARGLQSIQQLQSPTSNERNSEAVVQQLKNQAKDSVELSEEAESALVAQRERESEQSLRADEAQTNLSQEEVTRQDEAVASRSGNINDLTSLLSAGQGSKGDLVDTQA